MKNCIICQEAKPFDQFNKEHIFPEAVGGNFTIKNVCRSCNENVGKNIDKPFLTHDFIALFRQIYQIRRGVRSIPNAFQSFNKNNPDFTLGLQDGRMMRQIKSKTTYNDEGKSGKHFTDASQISTDYIEKLKVRIAKRYNVSTDEVEFNMDAQEIPPDTITVYAPNLPIIFEAVKVAYEFASHRCSEYFFDPLGKQYAEMLKKGEINPYLMQQTYFHVNKMELVTDKKYCKALEEQHLIILHYVKDRGLVGTVKFFLFVPPMYHSFIMSTDERYADFKPVILLNDYKANKTTIIT